MKCPSIEWEDLVAHVDDELSAAASERVAAHLAACTDCAREVELLAMAGDCVAGLPRHEPGADFAERVGAAVASAPVAADLAGDGISPAGRLLRLWPAAAAAAVLVAAIGARTMLGREAATESILTATEERAIASDLYVLTNLDTLETVDAEELIALVDALDLLEGLEPEMSGLYAAAEDGDGG